MLLLTKNKPEIANNSQGWTSRFQRSLSSDRLGKLVRPGRETAPSAIASTNVVVVPPSPVASAGDMPDGRPTACWQITVPFPATALAIILRIDQPRNTYPKNSTPLPKQNHHEQHGLRSDHTHQGMLERMEFWQGHNSQSECLGC